MKILDKLSRFLFCASALWMLILPSWYAVIAILITGITMWFFDEPDTNEWWEDRN